VSKYVEAFGKIPPQAVDLEEAILAAIIIDGGINTRKILNLLKTEIFYSGSNKIICEALINLRDQKSSIDSLLVCAELKKIEKLEVIGGPYQISILTNKIVSVTNIEYWYRIVYQKWIQREIINKCFECYNKAFDDSTDPFDMLDVISEWSHKLNSVSELQSSSTNIHLAVQNTINDLLLYQDGERKSFFRTGYKKWDEMISFSPGLMLMSGSGGIGKTSFVTCLMHLLMAINNDISIFWNCIDHDDHSSIIRKFISQKLYLTDKQLTGKKGKLDEVTLHDIIALKEYISNFDIVFQEKSETVKNMGKMFYNFCEKRKDNKLNIMLLDNVMRVQENKKKDIKNQNIIDDIIANDIADIYKETKHFNPLIIYLHHMTKEQGSDFNMDSGYRPTLDHVKGSGRFIDVPEQIVLLNRPGAYGKLLLEYKDRKDLFQHMFVAEVIKNTNGPTGLIHFLCKMEYSYFEEL
jgi:replicative DNA helicase